MSSYAKILLLSAGLIGSQGCVADGLEANEGSSIAALTKGNGGVSGVDTNFCNNAAEPCVAGESDCDYDFQCSGALECGRDNGPFWGFDPLWDVCVEAHCNNGILDADEEAVDCGGADCGPDCTSLCGDLTPNGEDGHCTADCPCPAREGDCDNATHCIAGTTCVDNIGAEFGFAASLDVCLADTCDNGMIDGDETGVDCGPSCIPCPTASADIVSFGDALNDTATDVATDDAGNTVIVGRFLGNVDFGGGDLSVTPGGSGTATDIFVAMFDNAGAHVWSRSIGGIFADGNLGIAVALDAGNVVVGGNFNDTVDFGDASRTAAPAGVADAFVMVLEPADGTTRWSTSFGDASADAVYDVGLDNLGNVVAVGAFAGTVNFGGGDFTSAGGTDVFMVKYNATTGAHVRSRSYGGTDDDIGYAMAHSGGSLYVAGSFKGTATFNAVSLTANGGADAFIARVGRSSLTTASAVGFGGSGTDRVRSLVADSGYKVTAIGHFARTVDFGDGMPVTAVGRADIFVHSTNSGLERRWTQTFGGSGNDIGTAVALNPSTQGTYVTGYVNGAVSALPGELGLNDSFIIGYDKNGNTLFSVREGGADGDFGASISHRTDELRVVGGFENTATFGGTMVTSAGGQDIFMERVDI